MAMASSSSPQVTTPTQRAALRPMRCSLIARSYPVIGIVQSGRRGTAAEVVPRAVHRLCDQFGVQPGGVFVAIGPGIGGCWYEVAEASAAPFRARPIFGNGV